MIMPLSMHPVPQGGPMGLNHLNANLRYLEDKTNAIQAPPSVVHSQAEMLALDAIVGNIAIRTDITDASNQFILTALPAGFLDNWMQLPMPVSPVKSVNGKTGNVIIEAADLLGNGWSGVEHDDVYSPGWHVQNGLDKPTRYIPNVPMANLQNVINGLPKYLDRVISIGCLAGTFNGNLAILHFAGSGSLKKLFNIFTNESNSVIIKA
jgi:hypothetical protein